MHSIANVESQGRIGADGLREAEIGVYPSDTEWLTAKEAAAYLKVKVRTVLLWARQGKVRGHVLSGTKRRVWRFCKADLNAMLFAQTGPSGILTPPSVFVEKGDER